MKRASRGLCENIDSKVNHDMTNEWEKCMDVDCR